MVIKRLLFSHLFYLLTVFNLVDKDLSWFKARDEMFIDHQGSVPGDIPRNLFLSLLINETTETTYVNVVSVCHGAFHHSKKRFNRCSYISFIYSCFLCNLVYNICFGHGALYLSLKNSGRQI